MDISIVIPVYNEEKLIAECIRRVEAFLSLKSWSWEIIVSSDGSSDQTDSVVAELAKQRPQGQLKLLTADKNTGKGMAVRRGMLEAQGKFVLMTDVDLSAPVKEMDKLLASFDQGYDIAIGSRAVRAPGCDVQQSFKRWLSGRIFNLFVQALVIGGFKDTQCGFKCFKQKAARDIFSSQKLNGFSFDVEVLLLAKKKGFKIKEVPVMWKEAKASKVKLVHDSARMLRELLWLRQHG
jgi:dolichyl-phosphate beta-glucosyltransferase